MDGEWYGAGCNDNKGNTTIPVQLQRLGQGITVRESNADDEEQNGKTQAQAETFDIDQEGVNNVRILSQDAFRSKLVIYLNIAWAKKELKWPLKKTES